MRILRGLLRLLLRLVAALAVIIAVYVAWVLIAYRDIPVEQLEASYGGDKLQHLVIDGVKLRYKVEGQGPPVVLIHSHFYTMRMWQAWVDILKQDFTVIRYDLTSHGLTGPDPSEDYSRERAIQLLVGLLDHLGVKSASIVGSSTGGAIAWFMAASQPQRVDKLVLINAPGMPRITNKYMQRGMPAWGGYFFYLLPQAAFRPFLESPIVDKALVTEELLTEFHQMYRREGNRWAEFLRMSAWEPEDVSAYLAQITAPTLIMWGERNPQLPVEHVAQYTAQLVNAAYVEQVIYPDIGHVIPLEIPRQSALDTRKFLQGAATNTVVNTSTEE